MKRDIKLNISQLNGLSSKLVDYIEAVQTVVQAAGNFQETIRKQDSDAYQKLDGLWETNVKENAQELINRLSTIQYYLSGYITEMTSFITPDNENAMMRVDRNDIWFNYEQIAGEAINYMEDILLDTGSSWRDYHRNYYYDMRLSPEENEAGRAAVEAEVEAERLRRESNYENLAGFRSMLGGTVTEQLQGYVKELRQIYDENVVPFENTDDEYDASLGICYDEWCTAGDRFRDDLQERRDFICGAWNAVTDLVTGTVGLVWGITELMIYDQYSDFPASLVPVPEWLDADIQNMQDTFEQVIKDPGNVLESIGQSMFDTADEKGIAYSAGYVVADVAITILTTKGLDKLADAGKTEKIVNMADDVADAADDAGKAIEKAADAADDAAKAGKEAQEVAQSAETAAEGLEGNAGKVLGSGSKTIDDLINGLKETTNGKGVARNFEASGGYEQTLKDFEALNPTNVKDIQTKYGPGKVGTLSDGTKVVARPGSTTGGATLEIKVSNSKVYKIRY